MVLMTMETPQLRVFRCPLLQVLLFPVVTQRLCPHGPDCLSDHRDSPVLLDKVINAPVTLTSRLEPGTGDRIASRPVFLLKPSASGRHEGHHDGFW